LRDLGVAAILGPMEPEPRWSDTTLFLELLLDIKADVQRLLGYFEDGEDEEEVPEENT
jgi:hypothetical protein